MLNQSYRGIFPTGIPENAAVFYGGGGVTAGQANPAPVGIIAPAEISLKTDMSAELVLYAGNVIGSIWQRYDTDTDKWVDIPSRTAERYEIYYPHESGIAGTYRYRCKLVGLAGTAYTNEAVITVSEREPTVSARINKTEITPTASVKLIAEKTYADNGIKWQELLSGTWTDISGATSDILTLTYTHGVDMASEHQFRAVVEGIGGTAISDVLTLKVTYPEPIISLVSSSSSVTPPASVTITATVQYADYGIKWQQYVGGDWQEIPGETDSSYTDSYEADTPAGTRQYRAVASGYGGIVVSNPVIITLQYPAPTVSISGAQEGSILTLSAVTTNTKTIVWQKLNGTLWEPITGATGNTYSIDLDSGIPAGTYLYRVVATGNGGKAESNIVAVTISYEAPTVSIVSSKLKVYAPGDVTFGATAQHAHLGVKWQISRDNLTWQDIAGETSATMTYTFQTTDIGKPRIRCIASGHGGTSASNIIEIEVLAV